MEKLIELIKNNKMIAILTTVFLILIITSILIIKYLSNNGDDPIKKEYTLGLFGKNLITIYEGDEYIEPGYYAYYDNLDVKNQVIISGSVDNNKKGIYVLTYKIGDKILTRQIEVLEKESDIEDIRVFFELIGDYEITLNLNETYKESGFLSRDMNGNDLAKYVKISGAVNINKEGTYYIIYSLNYNNKMYELKRKVIVLPKKEELDINISYDNINYQKEITLNISAIGNDFKYIILPNKVVVNLQNTTYRITKNGTYSFYVYDNLGNFKEKNVVVSNIDNDIDSASCKVLVKVKNSEIVINASDTKSGISFYKYNGIEYKNNTINVDSLLNSASVVVYDKAGNYKNINCDLEVVEKIYGFILIGDSRFVGMKNYLGKDLRKNDKIIAKVGMGYNWLIDTAIGEVNKILKNNPDKKYYIMSNLGVNDFSSKYASKLSSLASGDWKEHIVGYISVNPYADNNPNSSNNKKIAKYNKEQKSKLKGVYYCDTYNGIGVANFKKSDSSGLHYNEATSKKIYDYIIKNCSF